MEESQAKRVLKILNELASKKEVCIKLWANRFGNSSRTTQRDFKIVRDFFGDSLIQTKRGCYKLLNSNIFFSLIEEGRQRESFERFVDFLTILDNSIKVLFRDSEIGFLEYLKGYNAKIFRFFESPVEVLKSPLFNDIKRAVLYRRCCNLVYEETQRRDFFDVKPYRILYAQNNWYLACMTKKYKFNGGFKLFRINYIAKFEVLPKEFKQDLEVLRHIENMQSLFEDYKKEKYRVVLRASKSIARYFKDKSYLKSQRVSKEHKDGSLELDYFINNEMEILPLVRRWLPDLKIVEPKWLDEMLKVQIMRYLKEI